MERYHRHGDLYARERLVRRLSPLARNLARRYAGRGESDEDLTQVALLGLLKAINRFDPSRGTKLRSYAAPTILGELKRHFRDVAWIVHVPRDLQQRALALTAALESLSTRLGRSPSLNELAEELSWTPEQVLEAREAATAYGTVSLDGRVSGQGDHEVVEIAETIGDYDPGYALVDDLDALGKAARKLDGRERLILSLRFRDEFTQTQIARHIGVSQMQVSRLLRRALSRLREESRAA